jgi:hypothetical protein
VPRDWGCLQTKGRESNRRKIEQLLDAKYSWWPRQFRDHLREVLNSKYYKDKWNGKKELELLGRIPAVFLARMDTAEVTQGELIAHSKDVGYSPDQTAWDKVLDLNPHVAFCRAIDQVLHGD